MTIFFYFIFIGFFAIFLRGFGASDVNLLPKIENYQYYANADFVDVNIWPHRVLDGNLKTNALYGWFIFFEDLPCDTPLKVSLRPKIRGVFAAKPTLETISYLKYIAFENSTKNDFFKNTVDGVRSAISPELSCPLPKGVNYTINQLIVRSNLKTPLLLNAKFWNVTVAMTKETGEHLVSFWLELELDDTEQIRAKRPSTLQRREMEKRRKLREKSEVGSKS